jgi:hypothetical protein
MCFNKALRQGFFVTALVSYVFFATTQSPLTAEQSSQRTSIPYGGESAGPSFGILTTSFDYPGTFRSIRDIDFRNLTVQVADEKAKPEWHFGLKNGKAEIHDRTELDSFTLDAVYYLPSSGHPERDFAIVVFDWFSASGSSGRTGIAQVFRLLDQRLKMTQQIDWDEHFDWDGPYKLFDEKTGKLVFRSAHYLPADSHCCVSAMDVVTVHWDGFKLVQTSIKPELTSYGKREGKALTTNSE